MTRQTLPEPLLIQVYSLMVAAAIGLATVILSAGALAGEDFLGGELEGPRALVDWVPFLSPEVLWGFLFLAVGAGLIWGIQKRWTIHLLRFCIVVYTFLALSFVTSDGVSAISLMAAVLALIHAGMHLILSVRIDVHGWR